MDAQTTAHARTTPPPLEVTASIRLRPEAFTADELARYGWASPTAAARAIGVSSSTLRRAIAGETVPGEQLIAALLAGTRRPFEQLFTVTVK